jgi:hypothetical protein
MRNGRKAPRAPRKGTWPTRTPPDTNELESGYLVLASKAQDVAWRLLAWAEMALAEVQDPETVKAIAATVAQAMRVVDEVHRTISLMPRRRPPEPIHITDDDLVEIVPPDEEVEEDEIAKA